MKKVKAIICSILLFVVIIALLFATIFIKGANGTSLFSFVVSGMAGLWIGDKVSNFYRWLREERTQR